MVLTQKGSPLRLETTTGDGGRFTIDHLPAGSYQLLLTHPGLKNREQQVEIEAGKTSFRKLQMLLSGFTDRIVVTGHPNLVTDSPTSQTEQTVSREEFKRTPAFTVADILSLAPGATFTEGSGPRDIAVSIRGSDERQSAFVRNLQIFEDGFPVTQPDGMSRTDLTDPHAYESVDVIEGPSSALYGNYATGGAINFHTRSGTDIHGLDAGADFGSYGYLNQYLAYGRSSKRYEMAAFVSNVRAEQATEHTRFNTTTVNFLGSAELSKHDRLTIKGINNNLGADLSLRLSQNQFRLNPFQTGCQLFTAAATAAGCASVNLFVDGANGPHTGQTAVQAGLGRHDRRSLGAFRWEHDLSPNTVWQTQAGFDERAIFQQQNTLLNRGTDPSGNLTSGLLRTKGAMLTYVSGFFNYIKIKSLTYNIIAGDPQAQGGQTQSIFGNQWNAGFHVRQEFRPKENWTLVGGLSGEHTTLRATARDFAYAGTTLPTATPITSIPADRSFFNLAPEIGGQYRPDAALLVHARLGTGYGTPQATQLFVNEQGLNGDNTSLKTQRNYGVDGGADWKLGAHLQTTLTGFYEWFHNEQVTQSAGVNLQSFTFNAPASQHRGIEAGFDWQLVPHALPGARLRTAYQYDNQEYSSYTETLTTGTVSKSFSRVGSRVPGVQPNFLNARALYDQSTGPLAGFGGFAETNYLSAFPVDNANLLHAAGYTLVNLNLHYNPPLGEGISSRLQFFFEVQNVTNRRYIGSVSNVTDSLNTATGAENGVAVLANATNSIYAGTPRASFGGVKLHF